MRACILADIHGNLAALDAALAAADTLGVDRWICLGDVVGYGPDPARCLERLRERDCDVLQGNHEAALLDQPTGRFNKAAAAAMDYTREVLGPVELAYVAGFGHEIRVDDRLLCVHGSPFDRDEYVLLPQQMRMILEEMGAWLCCCGHTHHQFVFDGKHSQSGPLSLELEPDRRYLINPGSVGQPRDGDVRAAFAIIDLEERRLELCRADYDLEITTRRMAEVGLPVYLAERLKLGQ